MQLNFLLSVSLSVNSSFVLITWYGLGDKNMPGHRQMAIRCSAAFLLVELVSLVPLNYRPFFRYFYPISGTSSQRLNNLDDHFDRTHDEWRAKANWLLQRPRQQRKKGETKCLLLWIVFVALDSMGHHCTGNPNGSRRMWHVIKCKPTQVQRAVFLVDWVDPPMAPGKMNNKIFNPFRINLRISNFTNKLVISRVKKHDIIPMTTSGFDEPPDLPVSGINTSMTRWYMCEVHKIMKTCPVKCTYSHFLSES